MAYLVEVTPHVRKVITTLGRQDKTAQQESGYFSRSEYMGARTPYPGMTLRGGQHLWRYRVGDYRIICSIEDQRVTVLVVDVAHRREVYR